jgi:hypothetical protein
LTEPAVSVFQQIMLGPRAKYAVGAIGVTTIAVAAVFIAAVVLPIEDHHPSCYWILDALATNKYHTVPYTTYDMCKPMLKASVPVGLMLMSTSGDSVRISLEFGEGGGNSSPIVVDYVNKHRLYYALNYCMFEPKRQLLVLTVASSAWSSVFNIPYVAPVWLHCLPSYPFVHATVF